MAYTESPQQQLVESQPMGLSTFEALKTARSDSMIIPSEEQRAQLQAILLQILDDVHAYCEHEHLTYLLSGGNVLGALRHQGFIPWDDDADLFMPRRDYLRFIDGFAEAYPGKYWLESPEHTPEVGIPIARIRREGTVARLYNDKAGEHMGVGVDIFVLEDVPDQPLLRTLHGIRCLLAGLFFSCRRFARDADYYRQLAADNPSLRRTTNIKIALGRLASVRPLEWWSGHIARVYSHYQLPNSTYISCPSGRLHYFGELFRREDFLPPAQASFEGRQLNIPRHPEVYLERLYGNWQEPPAPDKRELHGYEELDLGEEGLE